MPLFEILDSKPSHCCWLELNYSWPKIIFAPHLTVSINDAQMMQTPDLLIHTGMTQEENTTICSSVS